MRPILFLTFLLAFPLFAQEKNDSEKIGVRPYEMERAGRTTDAQPPLIDLENLDGWMVETIESEVSFTVSREQRLWGDHVAKLTYKNVPTEKKTPVVTLKPPKPIPIPQPFDCVNFWIYGNNWAWAPDVSTPCVSVTVVLQGSTKKPLHVQLGTVNWKEWFLLHKKLSAEQLASLGNAPVLEALEIRGGTNAEPRTLYFDNLSFLKEELPPLSFEPRPLRNVKLPEGQTTGTNTGPDTLPFPNREDTILPTCLANQYHNSHGTDEHVFKYEGSDGKLFWHYTPQTGTLDDLSCIWQTGSDTNSVSQRFHLHNSGLKFNEEKTDQKPILQSTQWQGDTLVTRWKFGSNEVEYRFTMKQKSLIVDVRCPGGNVKEFLSGGWTGLVNAKLVKVPYLTGNGSVRPAVLVSGSESNPLFILSMFDHTRSNASEFFWENKTEKNDVSAAACCRYNPKTDGKRNDCFERLFITVSPVFEEVLPNIPNDPSPWKHVTAERVWQSHGSSKHDSDYAYWSRVKRYGMEKILITDHETLWRDGGESFTFRTSAAPGRGGDEGQKEYTQKMHELGFLYGPYNNYTDYAPVNEFWNPDWVTRLPDGNYCSGWARCYNPKPAVAVQTEPKITEIIQKKFDFNTAYCDVHTALYLTRLEAGRFRTIGILLS